MRLDATRFAHSPYAPMFRRFEIIEEEEDGNRTVNAEMLRWANKSDGYTKTGRKVFLHSLDYVDHETNVPDVGTKVWAIWMYDTSVWEVVGGGGGGASGEGYVAKSPSAGIGAMSGTVAGAATVDVYEISSGGVLQPAGFSITAFNISSSSVSGDKYIQVKKEGASGKYIVDFEDCT